MQPKDNNTDNILVFLDNYLDQADDDTGLAIARDFKARRIEKDISQSAIAAQAGVPVANVARFEQKGLISLANLIKLAQALGYLGEVKNIFAEPKYSTMDELAQIKRNKGKKRAYETKKD